MQREISLREEILNHFDGTSLTVLSTLGVTPILAAVVHGDPPLLCGILMPYAGVTFENALDGQVTVQHLVSLVKSVGHLRAAGVVHGDICRRNVCIDSSSTQLIDFGEIIPGYKNDVVATGELLLWCVERMTITNKVKERITKAASDLIELEDLDAAFVVLDDCGRGVE
jgi:tRNA A-37 threonylcarbamoyl transferase component Bud32